MTGGHVHVIAAFVLGFAAGLANTAHCLGMCGGFPLHLAGHSSRGRGVLRQLLFLGGKGLTYTFLGALAGAFGVVLLKNTPLAGASQALKIGAGALTIVFGLAMLGLRLPYLPGTYRLAESSVVRNSLGNLLTNPSPGAALSLGLGVGFIPCPLPIAMLLAAAASHSVLTGMLIMSGVALGTAPGLFAAGLLGWAADRRFASRGLRAAGVVVLIVGLLTVGRASGLIGHKSTPAASGTTHSKPAPTTPSCCGGESR